MPKLIIDTREIHVPQGTKVIEAAERLGIYVPRFCYHPALGPVGACRVCAVKFIEGPVKGIHMSCMTDAREGMVVSTTDAEVVDFRRHVIEWLMMNHPHDCPVCDEGGHCLLQDMTVSGGHGLRRFQGPKRTYTDQDLGPLVQHEMNRCIHCYRCARFYQEFCGYRDLGVMQIGRRTCFGRFAAGVLESPFSGNLSDLCPTGVYTDKPARYKGRRWDFERTPSICVHCSLGCHITVSARYREIVRHEARYSPDINGHFICDRGRFGFYYAEDPKRPRRARVDGRETDMRQAVRVVRERLERMASTAGSGIVACAGGPGGSLETMYALTQLCGDKGWTGPSLFSHAGQAGRTMAAVGRLEDGLDVSLGQVESADFILAVGADAVNEAPMLALAMRQAFRNGAAIAVIDPRPMTLPFHCDHLPVAPAVMDVCLGAIVRAAVEGNDPAALGDEVMAYYHGLPSPEDFPQLDETRIARIVRGLQAASRPVFICGTEVVTADTPHTAADCALLLRAAGKAAGMFYLLPGAGAFGAACLGGFPFDDILARIESGDVKALILAEWDPLQAYPDRPRIERALNSLELLVVLDHLDSPAGRNADVMLPTTTLYESGGFFINQEGRLQHARPAYRGGSAIVRTGGGSHPPRQYGAVIPGGQPWPAWKILGYLGTGEQERTFPADRLLHRLGLPAGTRVSEAGLRMTLTPDTTRHFQTRIPQPNRETPGDLLLLTAALTFGTETPSALSPPLRQVETPPCLLMNAGDAAGLNLADGDRVRLSTGAGEMTVRIRLHEDMAAGVLILPRHHRLDWRILAPGENRIAAGQLTRV